MIVVKFGGELLEDRRQLGLAASAVRRMAGSGRLVVVHGGGRAIDVGLRAAGLEKRQVEGLRITDEASLEVVVAVLAGAINTRFVAALEAAGVAAVGLTGADGRCGLSEQAPPHATLDGRTVDLGFVGMPAADADMRLLHALTAAEFVPVVASIGIGRDGGLLNINADTLAAHFAARLGARRLVIAGTTPGVLGPDGGTIRRLEADRIAALLSDGTATAGMIAKLRAAEAAMAGGAGDVVIVDGRDPAVLAAAAVDEEPAKATRLVARAAEVREP